MKKILFVSFCIALATVAKGQELSADKLFDMLSLPAPKVESQLLNKKYRFTGNEFFGDTLIKRYEYRPARYGKKRQQDSVKKFSINYLPHFLILKSIHPLFYHHPTYDR